MHCGGAAAECGAGMWGSHQWVRPASPSPRPTNQSSPAISAPGVWQPLFFQYLSICSEAPSHATHSQPRAQHSAWRVGTWSRLGQQIAWQTAQSPCFRAGWKRQSFQTKTKKREVIQPPCTKSDKDQSQDLTSWLTLVSVSNSLGLLRATPCWFSCWILLRTAENRKIMVRY